MKANPTIAIIGSGVMAEAMIAGILRQKVTTADHGTRGRCARRTGGLNCMTSTA